MNEENKDTPQANPLKAKIIGNELSVWVREGNNTYIRTFIGENLKEVDSTYLYLNNLGTPY